MLTKRLAACAAQVTPAGVVCDVGTDHAYLPAELLQSGRCTRAVATDIHAGPLEDDYNGITVPYWGRSEVVFPYPYSKALPPYMLLSVEP